MIQRKKEFIKNKTNAKSWLNKLLDDQLNLNENYYKLGENFEEYEPIGKEKRIRDPYTNIAKRKRKLTGSEERLEELPSIFTQILTDPAKKVEAAKKVFDRIIKQVPPDYKNFKINYKEKNYITIQ